MTWAELLGVELPEGWPSLGSCPGVEPAHRWAAALARGRVVLDVGCHVGLTSAACLRGTWSVHGFDPNPQALADARALMAHLRLVGFVAHPLLVGERCTPAEPWWRDLAGSQTGSSRRGTPGRPPEAAPMTSLDRWCAARDVRPGLVLVDVEGFEGMVLAGAQALLGEVRPRWVVELHAGGDPVGILTHLREAGYQVEEVAPDAGLGEPEPAGWTGSGCVGSLVALPPGDDGVTLEPGG